MASSGRLLPPVTNKNKRQFAKKGLQSYTVAEMCFDTFFVIYRLPLVCHPKFYCVIVRTGQKLIWDAHCWWWCGWRTALMARPSSQVSAAFTTT